MEPRFDLDLAIVADHRLTRVVAARLAADLEASALPCRIDVVERAAASAAFRRRVVARSVVVQAAA